MQSEKDARCRRSGFKKRENTMDFSKRDWTLLREKLPGWQEAYMERLLQEYAVLLCSDGSPSERSWALDKRIREDKRSPGVQVMMRKADMLYILSGLLRDGAIEPMDLNEFSEELREKVLYLAKANS